MGKPKVQVLLSTYNGARFLKPLMDSLVTQDYSNIEILIRDDGSNDATKDILSGYESHSIKVVYGENLGAIQSFFRLMQLSNRDADYVAFCDQDDVWEKNKISRAISVLSEVVAAGPIMYCGRLAIVDEHLSFMRFSEIPHRPLSFRNALVENIATGCTVVINRAARDLISGTLPIKALMHDWWLYLVISAFGTVIFDDQPTIFYRQHGGNAIGAKAGLELWVKRFRRLIRTGGLRLVSQQAKEFRSIFGSSLPPDKKEILDRFLDERDTCLERIKYALSPDVYRHSTIDDIILRGLIVLNRV